MNWRVLVIGDGPERGRIEQAIEDLHLRETVKITGFVTDVRPQVGACDAMAIVSTEVETFSIAALESMAMQKPMVMSQSRGVGEQVVEGQNGFLLAAGTVEELAGSHRELC